MKKQNMIIGFLIALILVSSAIIGVFYQGWFFSKNVEAEKAVDTYATSESVDNLSDLINDFSHEMYQQFLPDNDENIFFSPYSIFVALSMTYEGAKNQTADEMYNVLGFPQNNTTSLCSFGRIYNLLNLEKEYTLNTANALWIKEGYPFLQSYLDFIDKYYMGKATPVDFSDKEQAASLINNWVEENTGGKIKDLIKTDDIHDYLAMILTNAIYFKGSWIHEFDSDLTTDKEFTLGSGEKTKTPMMTHSDSDLKFNYTETDELQVLELPYKGDDLSMIIVLPKENNISIAEEKINSENISKWKQQMIKTEVKVNLPRFKLETEYSLKDYLKDMGMNIPFTMNADFSGMTGKKDLFIEKIRHKAFVEVNEEGTEAAAATSTHMALTSIPSYIEFNADHPFLFMINHKPTDLILFMGKLGNPE